MFRWIIRRIFRRTHMHEWRTTHVNRYMHPMIQECDCGMVRTFEWRPNHEEIIGMPWDKGYWVQIDGKTSDYSVLD